MTTKELEKQLKKYSPKSFQDEISKGMELSSKYHTDQKRLSGEPFYNHSLRVGLTLANMGFETNTILGGLLHNVLSKNPDKVDEIEKEIINILGQDVLFLVHSCDDISKATGSHDTEYEVINKYILNSATDLRPVLIKLADTLDNVRTIEYMPSERVGSKIQKVFNIYGPLAEYLNLNLLKKELEEKALEIYRPEEYINIKNMLEQNGFTSEMRDKYISYFEGLLKNIPGTQIVHGRVKSIYSIYNKQKKILKEGYNINISNIPDLLAFRVITNSEDDCFKILEIIMDEGEILTPQFDDYISHPKPNGYKALQGPVILPSVSSNIVEIQILTQDMHYHNTYGPASHIAYKESKSRFAKATDKYNWVETIHKEMDRNISKREERRSLPIMVDIFGEKVYAFTPKGKIIQLDKGDTVVDFAYLVHTDIGNSMVSAKVNGKAVRLSYNVQTGDTIEIKTQTGKKNVNPDWMKYANSPSTQAKIQKTWKKV